MARALLLLLYKITNSYTYLLDSLGILLKGYTIGVVHALKEGYKVVKAPLVRSCILLVVLVIPYGDL